MPRRNVSETALTLISFAGENDADPHSVSIPHPNGSWDGADRQLGAAVLDTVAETLETKLGGLDDFEQAKVRSAAIEYGCRILNACGVDISGLGTPQAPNAQGGEVRG